MRNVVQQKGGHTGTNALIDIHAPSFRVPYATLGEEIPLNVELPDTRCVADNGRHDVGRCVEKRDDTRGCCVGMGGRDAGVSSNSRWRFGG